MSREKQIEEMAKVINGAVFSDFKKGHSVCIGTISTRLYNAGYRKATDVAADIFAEIEGKLGIGHDIFDAWRIIAELKKKYESEGAE